MPSRRTIAVLSGRTPAALEQSARSLSTWMVDHPEAPSARRTQYFELMGNRAQTNATTVEEEIARQSRDSALGRIRLTPGIANTETSILLSTYKA